MSGRAVDVCGNCGAPLDLTDDGKCRWCRANVRAVRPTARRAGRGRPGISWRWNWRLGAIAAVAAGLAAGLGIGISGYVGSHQPGPPTATASGPSGAAQAVAPGSTDLQALRQDFGPWRQLTGPRTSSPALLLLESGSAYVSERWTVPSTATWWAQDIGGNVTSVKTSGDHAIITDADGTGYSVGINQAFIISSNPGTVLLISPSSTVMSMPLAQATAVRQPTLEINDQGLPYYTVTLMSPRLGWTFDAPVGVLVIDAHTGQITRYSLGGVPSWVDRVYSQQTSMTIANWYGEYSQAGFQGIGSSNANRFQVSGEPVMVYTGTGHPVWRMLLTSYNNDNSVSKIIEMNAATGAIRIYTPQRPMGIEDPVTQAFDNASGAGATLVKANHYQAVDLTLHVIYGHLTWMATYEPEGSNPSFVGIGFIDAYQATANSVVFGNNKSAALQNYLTQLASQGTANGTAPEQGGQYQTITGTIAAIGWDISGGQKYWYLSLAGQSGHVYVGTVASVGPALVLAQPGDRVTISILNVGARETSQTMQSFTDPRLPLHPPGS